MNGLEAISFRIISGVGAAKSCYMNALKLAREGNWKEAKEKIDEGYQYYIEGHKAHTELLNAEANEEKLDFSILLIHAEDQLMSTETIKVMVEEFINVYSEMRRYKTESKH